MGKPRWKPRQAMPDRGLRSGAETRPAGAGCEAVADAAAHADRHDAAAKLSPPPHRAFPRMRSGGEIGAQMEIRTSRFGVITVDEDRLMNFPRGLLGFPNYTRFALIQTGNGKLFLLAAMRRRSRPSPSSSPIRTCSSRITMFPFATETHERPRVYRHQVRADLGDLQQGRRLAHGQSARARSSSTARTAWRSRSC